MDEERSESVLNIDIEIIKIIKSSDVLGFFWGGGGTWQMHGPKMMCSQSSLCSHQNHIHIRYRSWDRKYCNKNCSVQTARTTHITWGHEVQTCNHLVVIWSFNPLIMKLNYCFMLLSECMQCSIWSSFCYVLYQYFMHLSHLNKHAIVLISLHSHSLNLTHSYFIWH